MIGTYRTALDGPQRAFTASLQACAALVLHRETHMPSALLTFNLPYLIVGNQRPKEAPEKYDPYGFYDKAGPLSLKPVEVISWASK